MGGKSLAESDFPTLAQILHKRLIAKSLRRQTNASNCGSRKTENEDRAPSLNPVRIKMFGFLKIFKKKPAETSAEEVYPEAVDPVPQRPEPRPIASPLAARPIPGTQGGGMG